MMPGTEHRTKLIVWLTGLSGAGKSSLAKGIGQRLRPWHAVEILDTDDVRRRLSGELAFTRQDRDTNIRRVGYVARLLARNGVAVVVAAISPYASTRAEVRREAEADGIVFVEVYVCAPLEVVSRRDVKGLYERARAGEIQNLSGVSDPYEPPARPDLCIRSDQEPPNDSVDRMLRLLAERGLVRQAPG
jgi:adenylyl-sulfate kinase